MASKNVSGQSLGSKSRKKKGFVRKSLSKMSFGKDKAKEFTGKELTVETSIESLGSKPHKKKGFIRKSLTKMNFGKDKNTEPVGKELTVKTSIESLGSKPHKKKGFTHKTLSKMSFGKDKTKEPKDTELTMKTSIESLGSKLHKKKECVRKSLCKTSFKEDKSKKLENEELIKENHKESLESRFNQQELSGRKSNNMTSEKAKPKELEKVGLSKLEKSCSPSLRLSYENMSHFDISGSTIALNNMDFRKYLQPKHKKKNIASRKKLLLDIKRDEVKRNLKRRKSILSRLQTKNENERNFEITKSDVLRSVVYITRRIIMLLINLQDMSIEFAGLLAEQDDRLLRICVHFYQMERRLKFSETVMQKLSENCTCCLLPEQWKNPRVSPLPSPSIKFDVQDYAIKICPYPILIIKKRLAMEWDWKGSVSDLSNEKENDLDPYTPYIEAAKQIGLTNENKLLNKKLDKKYSREENLEKNKNLYHFIKESLLGDSKSLQVKCLQNEDFFDRNRARARMVNLAQELSYRFEEIDTKEPTEDEYHTNLEVISQLSQNVKTLAWDIQNHLDSNLELIEKMKDWIQSNQNVLDDAIQLTLKLKNKFSFFDIL